MKKANGDDFLAVIADRMKRNGAKCDGADWGSDLAMRFANKYDEDVDIAAEALGISYKKAEAMLKKLIGGGD